MADPISMGTMAAVGLGSKVVGGIFGAAGSLVTAAGNKLGIDAQILGTMGQVFGLQTQAQQYEYQSNQAKYQAGVAEANLNIDKANESWVRDSGEVQAEQEGLKYRYQIADTRVNRAASGISLDSVTSSRVSSSLVTMSQWDEGMVRANAAKTAYGVEAQEVQDKAQIDLSTYTAAEDQVQKSSALQAADLAQQAIPIEESAKSMAGTAGYLSAAASLVGGAGSFASKWYEGNQYGVFNKPTQ